MRKKKDLSAFKLKMPKWPYRMFFVRCKQSLFAICSPLPYEKSSKHSAKPDISMGPTGLVGRTDTYSILAPDGVINFSRLEASENDHRIVWEYLGATDSAAALSQASPKRYALPQLSSTHPVLAGANSTRPNYNRLLYRSIDAGMDLRYEFFGYGLKKSLIIQKDGLASLYAFRLRTYGLSPQIGPSAHNIRFLDANKKAIFHLSIPILQDPRGKRKKPVPYTLLPVCQDEFVFFLELDPDWAHAKDRAFPLTVYFTLHYSNLDSSVTNHSWKKSDEKDKIIRKN